MYISQPLDVIDFNRGLVVLSLFYLRWMLEWRYRLSKELRGKGVVGALEDVYGFYEV